MAFMQNMRKNQGNLKTDCLVRLDLPKRGEIE
jgi:hypothetical protein